MLANTSCIEHMVQLPWNTAMTDLWCIDWPSDVGTGPVLQRVDLHNPVHPSIHLKFGDSLPTWCARVNILWGCPKIHCGESNKKSIKYICRGYPQESKPPTPNHHFNDVVSIYPLVI